MNTTHLQDHTLSNTKTIGWGRPDLRLMSTVALSPAPAARSKTTPKWRHLRWAVKKDVEFVKKSVSKGVEWANQAFRIPQVSKAVDDVVWLRILEDPNASPEPPLPRPPPSYPGGLSGVELLMADMKALETYGAYFFYLSKTWSKPLPQVYDAQKVAGYFNCRPHVLAFRLIEVFLSFAAAAIRIRFSGFNTDLDDYQLGMVLKESMLTLGPTFIKVGQSLSTRPDIIGTEISKALSELHDRIPPFPRSEAMKIIEEELGSPVDSFFSYISDEPVAAASFGQVYFARTLDGSSVAVKVQRPNMRHVVVRDIYILRLGLGLLQKIANRKSDLRLYADELGKGLVGELDYNLEAANASEFLEAHSSFTFMHAPKVLVHLTRKRVITMDWIVGEKPTDLLAASVGGSVERQRSDATKRLLDLVSKGVEATLVQLLETGILHADPHAGNLRYMSSGKLCFLDFGLLCRMEKKHQFAMLASIVHIVNGDWESLVYALVDMDVVRPGVNLRRVVWDLEYALGEVEFRDGIPDLKFSRVLGKIVSVTIKHNFRMPPYFTLLLRSLASLEGLALAADSNFKTFEAAYPYVFQKLLTENSAATNKILYSVVFNKKKEFQWQKFALFLRAGATRQGLLRVISSSDETSGDHFTSASSNAVELSNLVLRLLRSKEGVVLRRLLMIVDGASLVKAVVSREAEVFREQLCRLAADALYVWMYKTFIARTRVASHLPVSSMGSERSYSSRAYGYVSIWRDGRLRVIASRILRSARRKPRVMVEFYWTCFVMFVTASALACHRVLVSVSEAYLGPVSLRHNEYAIST